ncbi:uncharacterized protein LOC135477847 [Liolophura sinensis]|uniref:uncharacterized protein LOC135477847 n=1 Tax=Liolophura sinensis TaxID=3198878 RepID=UPI003158718B
MKQRFLFSCDACLCDHCDIYGDCCLGGSLQRTVSGESVDRLECLSGTEGWDLFKAQSYYFISHCPEKYLDIKTIEECEDRTHHVLVAVSSPPVYSPVSRLSYINSHCAKCHEDSELIQMWTPNLIYPEGLSLQTIKSKEDLLQLVEEGSAYHLSFSPPPNSVTRKCQRVEPIGECNITGKWQEYDPVLQEACGIYSHPLYICHQRYRNVFCAMCNGVFNRTQVDLVYICQSNADITPTELVKNVVPFSEIFDLTPDIPSPPTSGKKECHENYVFDTFKNKCRELMCAEGRTVRNHSCVGLLGTAQGVSYTLRFEITPEKLNSNPAKILQAFKQEMTRLSSTLRPFCEQFLMYEYNNREQISTVKTVPLWLEYNVIVGNLISQDEAEIGLLDTLNSSWFVHGAPGRSDFFSVHTGNDSEKFTRNTVYESETHGRKLCNSYLNETSVIILDKLSRCNQIELGDSEFFVNNTTGTITLIASGEDFNVFEYVVVDNKIRICVNFSGWYMHQGVPEDVDEIGHWLTLVSMGVSVIALFLTFILCLYSKSRNTVPGLITTMLVVTLFLAQGLFLLLPLISGNKWACQIIGLITHYSWLVVFAWKNVAAYHMYVAFTQPFTSRSTSPGRVLLKYALYAFGTPAILVTTYVVAQTVLSNQESLGYSQSCFLAAPVDLGLAFVAPVAVVIFTNSYFFTRVVYVLKKMSDFKKNSNQCDSAHIALFIKMSLMLGFLWVVGFLANIVEKTKAFWYLFDALNGGIGVVLFLIQISNKQTTQRLKKAFKPTEKRESSSTKLESSGRI